MNGEVKSYRLNEPMKWDEFLALPDDIKCLYIKSIRSKYNAPIAEIQKMFGCPRKPLRTILDKLNLNPGKPGKQKWDKEGFYAWLGHSNIAKIGESSDGDISSEEAKEILNMIGEGFECQSSEKVEEDSQEETAPCEPVCEKIVTDPLLEKLNRRVSATPQTGSLTFTGDATSIINTLVNLLRDSNVVISVKWEVV